ncbi:MAG: NUDIX hydrolase [Acidimicrobiales bacterium]|jgi:ADP-ribose pyrophosphatase|nr:NUDIX hydrolase [Acidimicrobiales bacterium]MDP6299366.1 NUDIX hydrolase [Acidimicrobiales bacterium]HJM28746.1 NUDIX hydrolase [Acidimicrobiales bacterium]HJM96659.1 NUDIX hydrolase [Acidimicrobiales bacterium]
MNPQKSFRNPKERAITSFEQIDETIRYEGDVISVVEANFLGPSGEKIKREIARHPGAVCIVPIVGSDIVMIRQYRPATGRHLLEIPAGKRDVADESPHLTAERELQEEVGLVSKDWILLAEFFNTPGFCDEYSYCYLALDCEPVPDNRQGLEEEYMSIERISLQDAGASISEGDLIDAKSMLGILLALQYLDG